MTCKRIGVAIATLGLALIVGPICNAQSMVLGVIPVVSTDDSGSVDTPYPSAAIWIAGKSRAPISNDPALPANRLILLVGFERRYEQFRGRFGRLSFSPSFLPAVYTTNNRKSVLKPCGSLDLCLISQPYASFGAGVFPLGVRFESARWRGLVFSGRLDGGGVLSTKRIPAESGTRFNFLAQGGVELARAVGSNAWLEVGFRHLHLSNGGRGNLNAGLDTPLLDLGLAWRK